MEKIIKKTKITSISKVTSVSTDIVLIDKRPPFLNLSNLNIFYNQFSRLSTLLHPSQLSQIIGHMLGDGSIYYASNHAHLPHFSIKQSIININYLIYSWALLSNLTQGTPSLRRNKSKVGDHLYYAVVYTTRAYPILLPIFNLFYYQVEGKWVKYISNELVNYLDARALAFWFMDDGSKHNKTCVIHTNNYTFNDTYKLAGLLHYRFDIETTVQNKGGKPVLYIKTNSFVKFKTLVLPYMEKSMLYKLGM